MIRALLSSTALVTALIAAPAFADDQKAPEADVAGATGANGVAELVVTATRTAQPIEKVGASVTVLQRFPGVVFLCDHTELAVEPAVAHSIVVEIG